MNLLDLRSVVFVSSLLGLVVLVILISQRKNSTPAILGINEWIAAFVAVVVAVALLILRPNLHLFWGVVLANSLIVMAVMLFDLGLRKFYGEPASFLPLFLVVGIFFVWRTFLIIDVTDYRLSLTSSGVALVCAYSFALWRMLRSASGTFGERVTQISFALPIVATALRLLTIEDVGQLSHLFQASWVQTVYLASIGIGIVTAGVGFILMVNERMRAELEKLAASLEQTTHELRHQNAIKSKVLAYAGHDIRQPLQAIHLRLASLMESGLDARQAQTARMIEASANALTDLLDSLLDLSKLDAGAVKPRLSGFDMDAMLAQLVQEFTPQACAKGLRLRLHLPAKEVVVRSDARLIASVLRNLIANAIKYTPSGTVLVAARPAGQGYKIQVWDTGVGISDEHRVHIFEEYFQVDNPQRDRGRGLGLGLAIVKRLSELLNLQLACRSRVGKGTVMEIWLPQAVLRPSPVNAGESDSSSLSMRGARIVLVEDSEEVGAAMVAWLRHFGAKVEHYTNAEDALADPGTARADLVLSDNRLSGGMSGLELLNRLRAGGHPDVKGVLLTGDTSSQFIETVNASGWHILFKPVHPRQLKALFKHLHDGASQPELI